MSTFRYPIEVADSAQEHFERLDALVDTGASYTWIPRPILERLGYSPLYQSRRFRTADGRIVERDLCRVHIRIGSEVQFTLCVIGDDQSEPLLGATTLEEFALGVDPLNHALVPVILNLASFHPETDDHSSG